MDIDKSKLKDSRERPLTQSLFLEIGYSEFAVYTLKDEDYTYHGKVYPSLKRLYIEEEDPVEYVFANKYLLGWDHWQRICNNKVLRKYVDQWREELSIKARSQAVQSIMDMALIDKSFQAAKWLAEKGWDKNPVGRPTKASKESDADFDRKMQEEYGAEIYRLLPKEK